MGETMKTSRSAVVYTLERTLNSTASTHTWCDRETTLMISALFMFLNRMDVSRCRIRRQPSPVYESKFSIVSHRHRHHHQHFIYYYIKIAQSYDGGGGGGVVVVVDVDRLVRALERLYR